jgi:hypothetical protein
VQNGGHGNIDTAHKLSLIYLTYLVTCQTTDLKSFHKMSDHQNIQVPYYIAPNFEITLRTAHNAARKRPVVKYSPFQFCVYFDFTKKHRKENKIRSIYGKVESLYF